VYLGLLDNLKVRRAGFAYRAPFQKFMERYLQPPPPTIPQNQTLTNPYPAFSFPLFSCTRYFLISKQCSYAAQRIWKGDDISGCKAILTDNYIGTDQYQIGKTKIFIRHPETVRCGSLASSIEN
jgi:myosin-1